LLTGNTSTSAILQPQSQLTVSSRFDRTQRSPASAMPIGIVVFSAGLVVAFFLRASSIPTGISSQHLFIACCFCLIGAFSYLWASRKLTVSSAVLVFILLTLPSLISAEDSRAAGFRWFGWVLVMATVGPLFSNEIKLKLQVLHWTRKLLLIFAVGSLLLNLFGIRLSGRGMFFGLTGHTMILAPVCALAAIDLFCTQKHQRPKWHVLLLVVCCVTCIGAGSRGAVIGMAVGILTHVVHRRQGFLVIAMAITALVAVGFVQSARSSDAVERDLEAGIYSELTAKGTNDTRGHLWAARLEEYMSSPVIGVGFQQQRIYRKDTDENFLEPGSSYLAVLSMTGTVGLIGFVWLVVSLFSSLFTSTSAVPTAYQDLLRGWTAFFAVHLIIEGYIFACGSLLCFLFWLTAGCSMSLHSLGRRKQMRDRTIVQMRAMQTLRKQAAA